MYQTENQRNGAKIARDYRIGDKSVANDLKIR